MLKISTPLPFLIFIIAIPIIFYPKWLNWINPNQPKIPFSVNLWLAVILRFGSVCCLVLALASLHGLVFTGAKSFVLIVDHSDSIPLSTRQFAHQQAEDIIDKLSDQDNSQIIFFGQQPILSSGLSIIHNSSINATETNISAAIETAITAFSPNMEKRLVVFTDGQQTQGNLANALNNLAGHEIQTFIVNLPIHYPSEVIVHELQVPESIQLSEEFIIRIILESQSNTTAPIEIWQIHQSKRVPIIKEKKINIIEGKQVIEFPHRIDSPGNYRFQVRLQIDDMFQENNQVFATTSVISEHPKILYVVDSLSENKIGNLWSTLDEMTSIEAKQIEAYQFPKNLIDLQFYQTVILDNLPIEVLSSSQIKTLEHYVDQTGGGLIVIGGNQSYGLGGYHDTIIENILPVKIQPKKRKQSLALVMLIDISGSMANQVGRRKKIDLALEGVRLAITGLDKPDMVSVIGFAERIIHDIPFSKDKSLILERLNQFEPSGGTKMLPALEMAIQRLENTESGHKHLLILSDGKSEGDFTSILRKISTSKISVSTIAVGNIAEGVLRKLAATGLGSYEHVRNASQLPKVLVDQVRRSQKYSVNETIEPIISSNNPILKQITRLPELDGYLATSEKKNAQILITSGTANSHGLDQPILAVWRYGLGQVAALTTDAGQQWSTKWKTSSHEYFSWHRFWLQLIMATRKNESSKKFEMQTQLVRGLNGIEGQVLLAGQVGIGMSATSVSPTGRLSPIDLQLTARDQAQGQFPLSEVGVYTVSVQIGNQQKIASLSVSYPLEYRHLGQNSQILTQISHHTNGVLNPSIDQITTPSRAKSTRRYFFTQPLLLASLTLFVLELIFRVWPLFQHPKRLEAIRGINTPINEHFEPHLETDDSLPDESSSLHQMLLAKQRSNHTGED